jgi:hypothetical protein
MFRFPGYAGSCRWPESIKRTKFAGSFAESKQVSKTVSPSN